MKETSVEAYHSVKEKVISDKAIVLHTMRTASQPMTSQQIADRCTLDYYQVSRRMSELERDGKVECTQEIALNKSGRKAYKWQIKE